MRFKINILLKSLVFIINLKSVSNKLLIKYFHITRSKCQNVFKPEIINFQNLIYCQNYGVSNSKSDLNVKKFKFRIFTLKKKLKSQFSVSIEENHECVVFI